MFSSNFCPISVKFLTKFHGDNLSDDKRNQLISGGKDGTLIVWTSDGQVIRILF